LPRYKVTKKNKWITQRKKKPMTGPFPKKQTKNEKYPKRKCRKENAPVHPIVASPDGVRLVTYITG
jgi:hypothetical protein